MREKIKTFGDHHKMAMTW